MQKKKKIEKQAIKMIWPHEKVSWDLNSMIKNSNTGLTRGKKKFEIKIRNKPSLLGLFTYL